MCKVCSCAEGPNIEEAPPNVRKGPTKFKFLIYGLLQFQGFYLLTTVECHKLVSGQNYILTNFNQPFLLFDCFLYTTITLLLALPSICYIVTYPDIGYCTGYNSQ